jgi:hypothetical protein
LQSAICLAGSAIAGYLDGMKRDHARESLFIFGMALLFASSFLPRLQIDVGRLVGVLAIGCVSVLAAVFAPQKQR